MKHLSIQYNTTAKSNGTLYQETKQNFDNSVDTVYSVNIVDNS